MFLFVCFGVSACAELQNLKEWVTRAVRVINTTNPQVALGRMYVNWSRNQLLAWEESSKAKDDTHRVKGTYSRIATHMEWRDDWYVTITKQPGLTHFKPLILEACCSSISPSICYEFHFLVYITFPHNSQKTAAHLTQNCGVKTKKTKVITIGGWMTVCSCSN